MEDPSIFFPPKENHQKKNTKFLKLVLRKKKSKKKKHNFHNLAVRYNKELGLYFFQNPLSVANPIKKNVSMQKRLRKD